MVKVSLDVNIQRTMVTYVTFVGACEMDRLRVCDIHWLGCSYMQTAVLINANFRLHCIRPIMGRPKSRGELGMKVSVEHNVYVP